MVESLDILKKQCYTSDKLEGEKNFLIIRYVFRVISIRLTWLFLRIGISANQTTLLSISSGVLGAILLGTGQYKSMILGGILINLWLILDNVDGEIARYSGATHFGMYYDTTNADIMYVLLFIAIGTGIYNSSEPKFMDLDPGVFLLLGGIASLFKILFRLSELRLYTYMELLPSKSNDFDINEQNEPGSEITLKFIILNYVFNQVGLLHPLVPILAFFNRLDVYIIFYGLSFPLLYIFLLLIQYSRILELKNEYEGIKII